MSIFQDLHDSDIDFCLIVGSGFQVKLGSELKGFDCTAQLDSYSEVEDWLVGAALAHHPTTEFARRYRDHPRGDTFERSQELKDLAPTADAPTS